MNVSEHFLVAQIHEQAIRDILVLRDGWGQEHAGAGFPLIQTASEDRRSKVIDFTGRVLETFDLRAPLYSLTHTPEDPGSTLGFEEGLVFGSKQVMIRGADCQERETFHESHNVGQVWKVRYTTVGTELYAACDDGHVRR